MNIYIYTICSIKQKTILQKNACFENVLQSMLIDHQIQRKRKQK